jgi:RNA polymerase sigma-70 factor (ECF subfamily)
MFSGAGCQSAARALFAAGAGLVSGMQDDSALFESLAARHQERFYRVAYRMAGNHEDAQDLLQDALIEAYRAFAHFKRGTYFDKWLYRIMSRTFIDRKRAKRRTPVVSLDAPGGAGHDGDGKLEWEIPDQSMDPGARIETQTLAEPIQCALDALPPDFRLVLILADVEEFSYEEIGDMLSCPVGTVRSRLHRARAHMKKSLEKQGYIH